MPIDPRIALQYQSPDIGNPVYDYARTKNALLENKRAQMEMDAAKADQAEVDALKDYIHNTDITTSEGRAGLAKFGKRGLEFGKLLDERRKSQMDAEKEQRGMFVDLVKFGLSNPDKIEGALDHYAKVTGDDVTDEKAELAQIGPDPEARRRWVMGHVATVQDQFPEFKQLSLGDRTVIQGFDKATGQPVGQGTSYREGMKPGEQQRIDLERQRVALEGQRVREGIAFSPSLTEVVNPENPKQMLRVDAKVYRGGGANAPGVIGVSGKEPVAAGKELQTEEGRQSVDAQVASLRDLYTQLQESGGITDTNNTGMENLSAGAASSGAGQAMGRLFGTKNQSLRNQIAQSRPLLLQAIKNATGMSAKQMDSNVELKMYLAAATDPTLDVQANLAALDNLSKLYGLGNASQTGGASGTFDKTPTTTGGGASVSNW